MRGPRASVGGEAGELEARRGGEADREGAETDCEGEGANCRGGADFGVSGLHETSLGSLGTQGGGIKE